MGQEEGRRFRVVSDLCFEGELPENALSQIEAAILEKGEDTICKWSGLDLSGKPISQIMKYETIPPTIVFIFEKEDKSARYESIYFNPEFGGCPPFKIYAADVAAYFLITQKALVKGISPKQIKDAFEATFKSWKQEQTGKTKQEELAKKLAS